MTALPFGNKLAAGLIFLIAVFAVYANAVNSEFVFDDGLLVETQLKHFEKFGFFTSFKYTFENKRFFHRPLRNLSYYVDYKMFGMDPLTFHVMNIIYHFLAVFAAYLLAERIFRRPAPALVAALVFGLHPVQTQSVAYVSGRKDILMALFLLLSLYFFFSARLKGKHRTGYLTLSMFFFGLSLMSKETAIIIPFLLLAADCFFFTGREESVKKSLVGILRRHALFYGTFLVIAVTGFMVMLFFGDWILNEPFHGGTPYINYLTVIKLQGFYLMQTIAPIRLVADYSALDFYPRTIFEPPVLLSILCLAILAVLMYHLAKKRSPYGFGLLFHFIALLPVSQIIPFHELRSEHYLYLPIFGFSLIIGAACRDLSLRSRKIKAGAACCLVVLLLFYGVRTILRNGDWQNDYALYSSTLEQVPRSLRVRVNLGITLIEQKKIEQARSLLKEAVTLIKEKQEIFRNMDESNRGKNFPNYERDAPVPYYYLGLISYYHDDDPDKAEPMFLKALEIQPRFSPALMLMGDINARRENYADAVDYYEKAYRYNPYFTKALYRKGWALYLMGEYESALKSLEESAEYGEEIPGKLINELEARTGRESRRTPRRWE